MAQYSEFVNLAKLETTFHQDPNYTQHRMGERWTRQKRLGRGAFGTVWLEKCVHGDKNGELRAVKEIQKRGFGHYERELEALALFSQPKYQHRFVTFFGWYDDDEDVYLAMQYFYHGDLSQHIKPSLPEEECRRIVAQILEGLQYMHDQDFAHRDLKPQNILVANPGPDWRVKIADFGISKQAAQGLTALRTQVGTPAFVAPETISYLRQADTQYEPYTGAVDVWSLSVMTLLMLTGYCPFDDDGTRLKQYVRGEYGFPIDILLATRVSEDACDFLKKLMVSRPESRLSVANCRQHRWIHEIQFLPVYLRIQRFDNDFREPNSRNNLFEGNHETPASASWTTHDLASPSTVDESEPEAFVRTTVSLRGDETAKSVSMETNAWSMKHRFRPHLDAVYAVSFSPDGGRIVIGSCDGSIRHWDPTNLAARSKILALDQEKNPWGSLSYSPDGGQLASGNKWGEIKLWDLVTGALIRTIKTHEQSPLCLVHSPDGKNIASVHSRRIEIWQSETGNLRTRLYGHQKGIYSLSYSPDGSEIASGSIDCTIKIWDANRNDAPSQMLRFGPSKALIRTLTGHKAEVLSVRYSPNGEQIASGSRDGEIGLWDRRTGSLRRSFTAHSEIVHSLAYSPDGSTLASGARDGTIKIWKLDQHKETLVQSLEHPGIIRAFATSPDGRQIVSGDTKGWITLWRKG